MPERGYRCLGKDDRAKITPERKRLPITRIQTLITVLGRPTSGGSEVAETPDPIVLSAPPGEPSVMPSPACTTPESNPSGTGPSMPAEPTDLQQGWPPPPTPVSGPAFNSLTREGKAELIRNHRNLEHPAPQVLSKHLKAAGADQSLVDADAALDFQCDTCLESTDPGHQRPGKLHPRWSSIT